jgi:hypothetical protein
MLASLIHPLSGRPGYSLIPTIKAFLILVVVSGWWKNASKIQRVIEVKNLCGRGKFPFLKTSPDNTFFSPGIFPVFDPACFF